jgi:hypothetical protein
MSPQPSVSSRAELHLFLARDLQEFPLPQSVVTDCLKKKEGKKERKKEERKKEVFIRQW